METTAMDMVLSVGLTYAGGFGTEPAERHGTTVRNVPPDRGTELATW